MCALECCLGLKLSDKKKTLKVVIISFKVSGKSLFALGYRREYCTALIVGSVADGLCIF